MADTLFQSEEDVERQEREQREEARRTRDAAKARERHSNIISQLNVNVEEVKDAEVPPQTMVRMEKWLTKNKCYHSNIYQVLLEYEITDPGKIEKVSAKLIKTIIHEAKTEFVYSEGIDAATQKFRQAWRKRVERASTSPLSPRSANPRSPGRSPRSPGRSSRAGNAPAVADGEGLELRRWLKQKDVWQIELWEILVEKGYQSGDDISNCPRKDFDILIRDTRLQYNRQVQSTMQRGRFEKNLEKFIKLYRKIAVKEELFDRSAMDGAVKIHSAARVNSLPNCPELKSYMRTNDFWNVDLYKALVEAGIQNPDQLLESPETVIRECEQKVRVTKLKELKTKMMRERLEKTLTKFRKHWQRNSLVEYDEDDGEYYEDEDEYGDEE